MKSVYTLPFILLIQTIHSKKHCGIDFVALTGADSNVVQNGKTYTTVGNADNAWSTTTTNLIADEFFQSKEVKAIIDDLNEVADYASHGLRTLSSNYEQVASETERKRCDFASGSRLNLESVEVSGNNLAKIVWQVKELALFIKIGLVRKEHFTVFNSQIVNCINHLPGRHDNLKSQVSRDMAMFESVINRDLPGSSEADKKSKKNFPFMPFMDESTISSISSYNDYYASNHGKSVYTKLFSGLTALSDVSSLKSKFSAANQCQDNPTEITNSLSWSTFEEFAFKVAMGLTPPAACDDKITVSTFEEASVEVLKLLVDSEEDLEARQLAYDTALNAIKQRDADVKAHDGYDRKMVSCVILLVVLAILTFLSRGERLYIDELQRREDEENSKPVKCSFNIRKNQ